MTAVPAAVVAVRSGFTRWRTVGAARAAARSACAATGHDLERFCRGGEATCWQARCRDRRCGLLVTVAPSRRRFTVDVYPDVALRCPIAPTLL